MPVTKPEGKRSLEDRGVDGRVILKLILNKQGMMKALTESIWLTI
jgi:hypothetical protein